MLPEVTVILRIDRKQKFIKETIASILQQRDVNLELIVFHDGLINQSVDILESFGDPRLKQISLSPKKGEVLYRNLLITKNRSSFILQATLGCILLPHAIKSLIEKIKISERIGVVYCASFAEDKEGKFTRKSFHKGIERLVNYFTPAFDYRKNLLYKAQLMDGVYLYRRSVLDVIRPIIGRVYLDVNIQFSLQLPEHFQVSFLPQALFYRKYEKTISFFSRLKKIRRWLKVLRIFLNLRNSNKLLSLGITEYPLIKVVSCGLYEVSGLRPIVKWFVRIYKRFYRSLSWSVMKPISLASYEFARKILSRQTLSSADIKNIPDNCSKQRIAYFIWRYPEMSQTFVQRELAALRGSGVTVYVIAESFEEDHFLVEYQKQLIEDNICLHPINEIKLKHYRRNFFFKNPTQYLKLFFYVVGRNYHLNKTFKFDKKIFFKSVYLAGILRENNITHIHSPWADLNAFIALIASRLLGLPFSVQARAHDIHRKTYRYGLQEKFENADFVVTNTQYNMAHIRELLNHANNDRANLIYNGLNLDHFQPNGRKKELSEPVRILCVARLIEQKGLTYLLNACAQLRQRGIAFKCQVIGGPENPLFMNYYVELKKLHKRLRLQDRVTFLGAQPFDQVIEAYQEADIFVLPCVIAENGSRDITPNSLIEAMAMNLPVISTSITGIPEIVDNGVNGILVPPNDEIALFEAMLKLIRDESFRLELGNRGRQKVEKRFDVNKNIVQYINLFKSNNRL